MSKSKVCAVIFLLVVFSIVLPACSSGLVGFSGISDKGGETDPETEKAFEEATSQAEIAACKANRVSIKNYTEMYAAENGEYPGSLQELVSAGYLDKVPTCPKSNDSGKSYVYDPSSGKISCPNGHPDLDPSE